VQLREREQSSGLFDNWGASDHGWIGYQRHYGDEIYVYAIQYPEL
jgi:hypothetical protein